MYISLIFNFLYNNLYNSFKHDTIIKKETSKNMLKWNTIYGFSSFTYGMVGLIMYFFLQNTFTTEQYSIPIPIKLYGLLFILQSIVTFIADVYYINEKSIFHNIDRLVATLNTLFVCISVYYISYIEKTIFCIALINGLYLLDKSRLYRKNENIELYSYYHTMWHLTFPLYLLMWLSYRNIMFISYE